MKNTNAWITPLALAAFFLLAAAPAQSGQESPTEASEIAEGVPKATPAPNPNPKVKQAKAKKLDQQAQSSAPKVDPDQAEPQVK